MKAVKFDPPLILGGILTVPLRIDEHLMMFRSPEGLLGFIETAVQHLKPRAG